MNSSDVTLQVVCAWPVSGQYGPGARILYYVLVAACVFARKVEWLRNACLAAALLLPAVAAIHAIILAAWHVDGAVDMDVYGAFQLCSIGMLAAPVTARMSRTYFYGPGRNAIFLWTLLVLTGLLSLAVEFYRLGSTGCIQDGPESPISSNPVNFPYDKTPNCGIVCNTTAGPFSPMRGGSANNIYVIPAPDAFTFGEAMLLAVACCIPGVLSLVSIWNKIIEIKFGRKDKTKDAEKMRGINDIIKSFLSVVEIVFFAAAIIGILIIGEKNFWSPQVSYQIEPIATVGQWSPIAGTGLALLGSLFLLVGADMEAEKEEAQKAENGAMGNTEADPEALTHTCNCPYHHYGDDPRAQILREPLDETPGGRDHHPLDGAMFESPGPEATRLPDISPLGLGLVRTSSQSGVVQSPDSMHLTRSSDLVSLPTPSPHQIETSPLQKTQTPDSGAGRRTVAKYLNITAEKLGTVTRDTLEDSHFKTGKSSEFPEVPGERNRNSLLPKIKERYNRRDTDNDVRGHAIPPNDHRPSRAESSREVAPLATPKATSLHAPQWTSPLPSPQRPHSATLPDSGTYPASQTLTDHRSAAPSSSVGTTGSPAQQRQHSTPEVPSSASHESNRGPDFRPATMPCLQLTQTAPTASRSPVIVISDDLDSHSSDSSSSSCLPATETPLEGAGQPIQP